MPPVLVSSRRISCSNPREKGIQVHSIRVTNRDGVKRWESEEGYEMFRFNVPGKSGFYTVLYLRTGRSAGRRWFFNKPSEKAVLYYVKVDNDIPPIEGWKVLLCIRFDS